MKIIKTPDFWIAILILGMGVTLILASPTNEDIGVKIVLISVGAFMIGVGVTLIVDGLKRQRHERRGETDRHKEEQNNGKA